MVNELQEVQWAYLIDPCFQIENTAGRPNTGGWINIYIAGTRTKYYAASDFSGTLHPFNIPLDSLGSNIILVSPANKYDIYVLNKFGTLVMSRYNVSPQVAGTSIVSGGVVLDSSDGTITIEQTGDNIYNLSIADIIDSVTANIDESITNIEGDITEINQEITNITNIVTGLPTHADVYDSIVTGIEYVTGLIPQAQVQSDWDEDNPSDPAYILNKPDLDNYVTEQELIEVVSGISGLNLEYGQFYCQTTTGGAVMGRTKGNIEVTNDGKIKLKKGQSYHVTVRGGYSKATASADYNVLSYIEYITGQNINVNVDNSVTDTQYFEISYDLYKLSSDKDYYVFFSLPTGSSVNNLFIEIHSIGCMGTGGSGSGVPVEYDAGWGINIVDNVISVDPSILNQYVTEGELATAIDNIIETVTGLIPEAQVQADWDETDPLDPSYINNKPDLDNYVTQEELASAVSGLAPEYTAGDNIVIDDNTISLSDVVTINAREGQSSGFMAFGNITHWGDQDYGPGWTIAAHTDRGVDYHSYNTCDQGMEAFFWGDYEHDRATGSVSGQSLLLISEGDITYASGAFQDTTTLPVIWSCSQMAQDISELQGAITAVTGVSADNIVDYDDADLFDKVEAIYNDGRSPIVRYTYSSTPGQGFPYSKETYFTEFFRYSEDNEHGHTNGYRFNYERHTGNYLENELIHFNSDGVKEHTQQFKSLEIEAGAGISVASGYDTSTIISINPTEVATAISGLLPTVPTYSAGNGIDITNNTISVDNTVALKTDIPDVSNFATETELQDGLELVSGLIPTDYVTDTELQDTAEAITAIIPAAQVNSDWNANSGVAQILNKPNMGEYLKTEDFHYYRADWTESDVQSDNYILNKPEEKELVAGENIVITENASAIIINSTGGGGSGSDVFAGDGIEIVSGVISVDNTVVRDSELMNYVTVSNLETASGNLIAYTDTASGNLVDYIDSIDKDAIFWVDSFTTYQAITDAIAANKIPVYLDTQSPATYGYLNEKGSNYYWFMAYKFQDKQLIDYDKVYNYFIYSDDRHSNTVGYTGINTVAGNGIDITRTYSSQSKQGFQTVSIDAAEIASSISGLLPSGPSYSAGDGIDITNDEISAKLGANMSFDSNDAITVDLNGVAEDAAGLVSGNIPHMELIAGNRIQIATSGVSAVINAVIPDAAKDAIFANSYDNPGWETTGTVTTYNPFGLAIHPDLVYDSYMIYNSRLVVKEIGSGFYYLDLFISMSGTPKAEYGSYQNYITITNGHFVSPTNSNVYDEWNSCFGSIHQDTLYGTGLDFNSVKPYDATRKHYVQLHTLVANW